MVAEKKKEIKLPCFGIVVELERNEPEERFSEGDQWDFGSIQSKLTEIEEHKKHHLEMMAIQSMVLGHAVAGLDIESNAYIEGIESAVDAVLEA